MNDVVEIFTNIEVAERFINAYIEACKVTLEKDGETERIETLNDEHERIKTMFFALKMTKVMQLPQLWKGKYSGLEKLRKLLDEDQYPHLMADIATVQEEAQELVKQVNTVVYSRGNEGGICDRKDGEIASAIRYGTEAFIEHSSFIIREMANEKARKDIVDELKMYL